ncbi:unnamed protein product [Gordionus sp. m RMFG-2023]|uniref:BPTI/Kunitz domain-containing protein 4-like n=1 Tax=Gordionus sp. m RMFG-2023 TaxID=3053472 RepID=UPI0030E51694
MNRYLLSTILILFYVVGYNSLNPDYKNCLKKPCNIRCAYGLIYDSKGCQHCQCIPKREKCPSKKPCNIRCRNGLIYNSKGCQLCQCIPPTKECPIIKPCTLLCRKGFVLKNDGCVCKCVPKECPNIPCNIRCINGLKQDIDGCQLCECVHPETTTTQRVCPDLPCFKFIKCAHGQVLDEYGCRTCSCKPSK